MFIRFESPKTYDSLIENFLTSDIFPSNSIEPAMDVVEQENEIIVIAELPGIKKEDVKITFEKNILTISGEGKATEFSGKTKILLNEIKCRPFNRSLKFGYEIDSSKISAEMNSGILTITLPKTEDVKAKEISIN
jgi:HSP20 family protein